MYYNWRRYEKTNENKSEPITNEPIPYDAETFQHTHHVLHENMCIRCLMQKVYCGNELDQF